MNLISSRLRLRPFRLADIGSTYLGWLNDPEVTRFSNQRFRDHTSQSCSAYLQSFVKTSNSFLLIEELDGTRPIGTATVYRKTYHGTADIGLMIGNKLCWGSGYGFEAWQAILEALLTDPGIRKVTGGTVRSNLAMLRIMEKSGMELEAVHSAQELIDGQPVDLLYFARFAKSAT